MQWLPEPPPGTRVALGFDGSETGDLTVIKAETIDGALLFTPRWLDRPTIWNPANHGGRIPRPEVDAAVDMLFNRFDVIRMYCDPPLWPAEIKTWKERHGDDRVLEFSTFKREHMGPALESFWSDVRWQRLRHDGCPITTEHIRNARMAHRSNGYILEKPDPGRKIDVAVASVVAHVAASHCREAEARRAKKAAPSSSIYVF